MPVQVALDPSLTRVDPEPAAPAANCLTPTGQSTPCTRDVFNYIDRIRAWGRIMANQLKRIDQVQPK